MTSKRPVKKFLGIGEKHWTPASEINMPARKVRRAVMTYNDEFGNNEQISYILHSVQGYRITTDEHEIFNSIQHDLNQYKHCIKRLSARMRRLSTIRNERMDIQ